MKIGARLCRSIAFEIVRPLLGRQVGNDGAAQATLGHGRGEAIHAVLKKDVVIAHEEERDVEGPRALSGKIETFLHGGARGQGLLIGVQDHRTVGNGLGKGDLQLHQINPRGHHGFNDLKRVFEGGISDDDVGHEQDLPLFQSGPQVGLKHGISPPS